MTPQLQDPLSRAFYNYLQILICIQVDLEWVYHSTKSKRSDKQCLRFNPISTWGGAVFHPEFCFLPLSFFVIDLIRPKFGNSS